MVDKGNLYQIVHILKTKHRRKRPQKRFVDRKKESYARADIDIFSESVVVGAFSIICDAIRESASAKEKFVCTLTTWSRSHHRV